VKTIKILCQAAVPTVMVGIMFTYLWSVAFWDYF
jgi:hypothetical protein